MGLFTERILTVVLLIALSDLCHGQTKRNIRAGVTTTTANSKLEFVCPEEFGYYPHPSDCTLYYVCVFGGAIQESCTGGLMYSHELQTCDWPRNVGCDAIQEAVTSAPVREQRIRFTSPSGPSSPSAPSGPSSSTAYSAPSGLAAPQQIRVAPNPVVTSRGQPRQQQQQQEYIAKLYEAQESLPPAEEIENDRQQRVYRGQPSTVGQVQRDRDGLGHSNALPSQGKVGSFSFGTQVAQSQPIQQYRVEPSSVAPNTYVPNERRVPSNPAAGSSRALYNGSQSYDPVQYDPYYAVYDDDVELYRDADYAQQYNANSQRPPQQNYRVTPTPQSTAAPAPQRESTYANPQHTQYDTQAQVYPNGEDYDDSLAQVNEQNTYRQPTRQQIRGDRNELNYVSEQTVSPVTRKPTFSTTPTPTTRTTTTTTTSRPFPSTAAPQRYNNKKRSQVFAMQNIYFVIICSSL